MSAIAWGQLAAFLTILLVAAWPVGNWMARVYGGERTWATRAMGPIERLLYRSAGIDPSHEMTWHEYALSLLAFSAAGVVLVYLLQRFQGSLPFNPEHRGAVAPALAFNTALSFATNTNWQAYSGESSLGHLVQALGLTVQNFVSAASGLAVLFAFVRGLTRRSAATIGNFWADLVRGTLYLLLPLALIIAVTLTSQGVVESWRASRTVALLAPTPGAPATQTIALGPAASQEAIKELGTNGGGFFNANSAHPFENPTPASDLLETLAILLLPTAACFAFGRMAGDRRQGLALLLTMLVLIVPLIALETAAEQGPIAALAAAGAAPGGNLEGKELRFGIPASARFAVITTATSSGAVNTMHDSLTPLGGLIPLWLMQLGEVVFGGVGSGLYGMLLFVLVAVFIAGLMVGRTPEYLGKKIGAYEIKMASLAILIPSAAVLIGTALAVATTVGRAATLNPGPHGFSEILYAFSSAANNNGSAFGGLSADSWFYNLGLGAAMVVGRFWVAVPVLAIAGALAKKTPAPAGAGTLPTHGPLFVVLLAGTILLVGALTFLPSLALGPLVEHLLLHGAAR